MSIVQRRFPYPFNAMFALYSDIDACSPWLYEEIHRYLNTRETTPMGVGLGLDISDSFFMSNEGYYGVSLFDYTYKYNSETDYLKRQPYPTSPPSSIAKYAPAGSRNLEGDFAYPTGHNFIEKYLRCGWMESLHGGQAHYTKDITSWGSPGGWKRRDGQYLKNWLVERGILDKCKIFTNHSEVDSDFGFGSQFQLQGDNISNEAYWADISVQIFKYFWVYNPNTGWAFRADPWGKVSMLEPLTMRDGVSKAWKFSRFDSRYPYADKIDTLITASRLDALSNNKHFEIGYTHFGYWSTMKIVENTIFPENSKNALKLLRQYQDSGKVLTASTTRLLNYNLALNYLQFTTTENTNTVINITTINDPQCGSFTPNIEDIRGVTFYVTDSSMAEIKLNGVTVPENEIVRNPSDGTSQSIGIKWFEPDYTDYSNWTLEEVKVGTQKPPVQITSIIVSPKTATVKQSKTIQFTATAYDELNNPVATSFQWSVSDNTIATIDQNGLLTATGYGTVTVTATAGGITDTATVMIVKLSSIIISPKNITAKTNEQIQFIAKGYDQNGDEIPFTPQWSIIKN